jgi:hypothetical protein
MDNLNHVRITFYEGNNRDFVWRWYPQKADQKLGLGWTGPCLVKWKISEVLYQIKKDPDSRKLVVHVDHLKPYSSEN